MSETQTTAQATYNARHRKGVALMLREIQAEVRDLRGAIECVLAERQSEPPKDARK